MAMLNLGGFGAEGALNERASWVSGKFLSPEGNLISSPRALEWLYQRRSFGSVKFTGKNDGFDCKSKSTYTLTFGTGDEARPAEHLRRFTRDMFEHPRRLDLEHGKIRRLAAAGLHLPGAEIDPGLRRGDLAGAIGELDADRLVRRQLLAEGFAIGGPFDRFGERHPRHRAAAMRHAEPFAVEIAHDAGKAAIFGADEVFGRHFDIVEMDGGGIRTAPAHLVEPGP